MKKTNRSLVLELLEKNYLNNGEGLNTTEISEQLNMQRTNVSRILNELVDEGYAIKNDKKRPVVYVRSNLDFEYNGDALIAQIAIDCNSNEYSIKSGGIIIGDEPGDSGESEKKTEADAKTDAEANTTAKVYGEYAKLIEDNADAIKGYSWQNGNSEYGAKPLTPIAFCDINGDDVPGLFMMKKTKMIMMREMI